MLEDCLGRRQASRRRTASGEGRHSAWLFRPARSSASTCRAAAAMGIPPGGICHWSM